MKYIKSLVIFILVFYAGALISGEEEARLWNQFALDSRHASVVELAIKTRGSIFEDHTLELSSMLMDFTQENSIHKASLAAFEYLMGDDISPVMIDLQGFEDFGDGNFKDIVILFKDSTGNLLLVMKWFQSPNTFLSEISAMEKLYHLHLTESKLVAPLTFGKAFYNDKPYYLIAEAAAKGDTIISLINAIGKLSEELREQKRWKARLRLLLLKQRH